MQNGKELGEVLLESKGMKTEAYWIWLGIVIDLVITAVYTLANAAALAYFDFSDVGQPTEDVSETEIDEPVVSPLAQQAAVMPDLKPTGIYTADVPAATAGGHPSLTTKEAALPFTPVTLAFKDMYYTINLKDGQLVDLLQGVTGYAIPGTMTALMGR